MENEILKNILKKERFEEKGSLYCLNEIEIAEYLSDLLDQDRRERVCGHLILCESCFKKAAEAEKTFSLFVRNEANRPPSYIEKRIKMVIRRLNKTAKIKSYLKKNKFLYFGAVSLVFSFIFRRYFAQFLAIAVVLGFKWVMDTGGSKALIMIYDAWKTSRRSF